MAFDTTTTATLRAYTNSREFVDNYPFVPWHYHLGFAYAEGLAAAGARIILNDIRATLLTESVDTLTRKGYDAHG
ncbi:hypothetical protein MJI12_26055, partial [Salmonella enterica subsp. enterica serovar Kentucky]|nr:hypothetical protein [Salmonella enterica subsp. enterica serovar Kentucky]